MLGTEGSAAIVEPDEMRPEELLVEVEMVKPAETPEQSEIGQQNLKEQTETDP